MHQEIITNTPGETFKLGNKIGKFMKAGDVLSLSGDLGAGKTLLIKGICAQLEIDSTSVTSPTFTLINEYTGYLPVYHFDVYRLENPAELEDLGYEEYFYGLGVCLIEWGDVIESYLPHEYLQITIEKTTESLRSFLFKAYGKRYQVLLNTLFEEVVF